MITVAKYLRTKSRTNAPEFYLVLISFAVVNVLSVLFQRPVSENGGLVWEAIDYYAIAEQFANGQVPFGQAPFVYRIATPFIVSILFESNLIAGFKTLGVVANLGTVILFLFWLRVHISCWWVRNLLCLLFITQWHGPVRFVYSYPVFVDYLAFTHIVFGFYLMSHVRWITSNRGFILFILLSMLGVIIRESLLLIPFCFIFSGAARTLSAQFSRELKLSELIKFFPLIFSLAALAILHSSIPSSGQNEYSYSDTIVYFMIHKSFRAYLLGWYIAYGPVLVFVLFNLKRCRMLLAGHPHLAVYLACISALAWVGGTDTERFLYWAMPVVYVLIGRSIIDLLPLVKDFTLVFIVTITQVIGQRAIWTIPDYPGAAHYTWLILTPLGNDVKYLDLWSFHADPAVQALSLIHYLFLTAALLLYLWYRSRLLDKGGAARQ